MIKDKQTSSINHLPLSRPILLQARHGWEGFLTGIEIEGDINSGDQNAVKKCSQEVQKIISDAGYRPNHIVLQSINVFSIRFFFPEAIYRVKT